MRTTPSRMPLVMGHGARRALRGTSVSALPVWRFAAFPAGQTSRGRCPCVTMDRYSHLMPGKQEEAAVKVGVLLS